MARELATFLAKVTRQSRTPKKRRRGLGHYRDEKTVVSVALDREDLQCDFDEGHQPTQLRSCQDRIFQKTADGSHFYLSGHRPELLYLRPQTVTGKGFVIFGQEKFLGSRHARKLGRYWLALVGPK